MDVFAFSRFTAIMALVALALAVVALVLRMVSSAGTRAGLADAARWLAWLVAAASMAGSLIYSEVFHFEPCRLCWYQRIAMYPLAAVLLVGSLLRDARLRLYALPLSVGGFLISVWHYLIQTFPSLEGGSSCDPLNPCSAKYVDQFGFISIPFMAGAGFLLISVLLASFSASSPPVSEAS